MCVYSKANQSFVLRWIDFMIRTYGYMWWLVRTMSTHCSGIGSRCLEQARVRIYVLVGWDREHSLQRDWTSLQPVDSDSWIFNIEVCHCSELGCRYSELEIHCSETFTCCSEWSLPCDNRMLDIIDNLLGWYLNVCLVRIFSYDNAMYIIHIGTPVQAYTWDITNESLNCDMIAKY